MGWIKDIAGVILAASIALGALVLIDRCTDWAGDAIEAAHERMHE